MLRVDKDVFGFCTQKFDMICIDKSEFGGGVRMKKIIAMILCLVLALSLVGCNTKDSAIGMPVFAEQFDYSPSGVVEIDVASYGQAGETETAIYTDNDSINEICNLLTCMEVGEEAALEPAPEESVEITVLYDNEKTQLFAFNQGCFYTDGKYHLLSNEEALVNSEYWPLDN